MNNNINNDKQNNNRKSLNVVKVPYWKRKHALYVIHNHLIYSDTRFMDSTNGVKDSILYACKLGLAGINISDHQSLAGHFQAQRVMESIRAVDPQIDKHFRVTFGDEIYLVNRSDMKQAKLDDKKWIKATKQGKYMKYPYHHFYHFILTARNAHGYELLEKCNLKAWQDKFTFGKYNQRQTRLPTYKDWLAKEMKNYKGDVVASTACLGSELSQDILAIDRAKFMIKHKNNVTKNRKALREAKKDRKDFLTYLIKTFGKNNVYFELMPSRKRDQKVVNKTLWQLSKKVGIRTIISTDSHYLNKKDECLHEAVLHNESPARDVYDFYHYAHYFSYKQLEKFFSKQVLETSAKNSIQLLRSIKPIDLRHVKTTKAERNIQIKNGEDALKVVHRYAWRVHYELKDIRHYLKNLFFDLTTSTPR